MLNWENKEEIKQKIEEFRGQIIENSFFISELRCYSTIKNN